MGLSELIKQVFADHFLHPRPLLIKSPGRVNLIGEHTDYNDGFVLPAAIEKTIVLAIAPNNSDEVRVYSVDMDEEVQFSINDQQFKPDKHWAKYITGAIREVQQDGHRPGGFDAVFGGDIPIGAGLSSSAALEGAVMLAMNTLFDLKLSKAEMALYGQRTEHNHVGVRCGIMDQFVNLHGEDSKVLKLDCRSLEYELVPFERDDLSIVLCNSKVSHNLASSEYNVRRSQCEEGVSILQQYDSGIKNLRDVSLDLLEEHKDEMPEVVYKRCRYVLEENQRVLDACEDLEKQDFKSFGERMLASHEGLSNDYEVSCEELDILVDIAKDLDGVFGCRMMGGGFGGCTINLVQEEYVSDFVETVKSSYKKKTGIDTEIYITKIDAGTHIEEPIAETKS